MIVSAEATSCGLGSALIAVEPSEDKGKPGEGSAFTFGALYLGIHRAGLRARVHLTHYSPWGGQHPEVSDGNLGEKIPGAERGFVKNRILLLSARDSAHWVDILS